MIASDTSVEALKAALRVYVEAKFSEEPRDSAIPLSKFVCNQVHEIYDALLERLGGEKDDYLEWRFLTKDRHEFKVLMKRLKECEGWQGYSDLRKQEILDALLSPYLLNKDLRQEVLNTINARK